GLLLSSTSRCRSRAHAKWVRRIGAFGAVKKTEGGANPFRRAWALTIPTVALSPSRSSRFASKVTLRRTMHVEPGRTLSDEALLRAYRDGDDSALSALLDRHAPGVHRFSRKMCGDAEDASDVLQETLLAAARGARDFRGGSSLSTWLYAIARSFCIK